MQPIVLVAAALAALPLASIHARDDEARLRCPRRVELRLSHK
jgi:hypothetical protein